MVGQSPYGMFVSKVYELFMTMWWDYEFMLNTSYLELNYERIWTVWAILFFQPFANIVLLPGWGAVALILGIITAIQVEFMERDLEIKDFEAFMKKGDSGLLDKETQEYK